MADDALRRLERRFAATGAVDDEVRLLVARLRAGELTPERLRLASFCGHLAASKALGKKEPTPRDIYDWSDAVLARWGKEARVRATLAIARAVLPRWEARCGDDPAPRRALEAAECWLACPCEKHARIADRAGEVAYESGEAHPAKTKPSIMAAHTASAAAREPWHTSRDGGGYLAVALITGGEVLGRGRNQAKLEQTREVAQQALVAWALRSPPGGPAPGTARTRRRRPTKAR